MNLVKSQSHQLQTDEPTRGPTLNPTLLYAKR